MAKKRPAGELIIPPAALADKSSVEMLRLWIAAGGLHCSLNVGHWEHHQGGEEDLAWGKVLADAIQHIASALHDSRGTDRGETIRRVLRALEKELGEPTTKYRGKFVRPGREPEG